MAGAAVFAINFLGNEPRFFHRHRLDQLTDAYLYQTTRLSRNLILNLIQILGPALERPTLRRDAIPIDTQLLVALTFYASGGFQWVSGMAGHISQATTSRIITAVTDALCDVAPQYINFPFTVVEQARTKQGFYAMSHFPRVLGAMDGTHINMRRPSGEHPEQYCNRHGRFSMNMMAVCNADLKFLYVLCDYPGSNGDGYIWGASRLSTAFRNGDIADGWLLGDSAYPLTPYLMTPLHNPVTDVERAYNAAHMRTRCSIERSFGLLKSRFRCLDDTGGILCYSPLRVYKIAKACCVLHNMCVDAGLEFEIDDALLGRIAEDGIRNGPPPHQQAGAGVAVQRRLIENHRWLPRQN